MKMGSAFGWRSLVWAGRGVPVVNKNEERGRRVLHPVVLDENRRSGIYFVWQVSEGGYLYIYICIHIYIYIYIIYIWDPIWV